MRQKSKKKKLSRANSVDEAVSANSQFLMYIGALNFNLSMSGQVMPFVVANRLSIFCQDVAIPTS